MKFSSKEAYLEWKEFSESAYGNFSIMLEQIEKLDNEKRIKARAYAKQYVEDVTNNHPMFVELLEKCLIGVAANSPSCHDGNSRVRVAYGALPST